MLLLHQSGESSSFSSPSLLSDSFPKTISSKAKAIIRFTAILLCVWLFDDVQDYTYGNLKKNKQTQNNTDNSNSLDKVLILDN